MDDIRAVIESAFERRGEISPGRAEPAVKKAVADAIALLDSGEARVAEPRDGGWIVNDWLKKAVLLSFRIDDSGVLEGGFTRYFDKVPSKYATMGEAEFRERGVRVVPPAVVRRGAWCAPGVVLMPSYVNLGAYVDRGTMVDTWATVGSCAQIGRNVHLSGGVGIGGVLEPLQASPTIIEDDCFIGARSENRRGRGGRTGLGDIDGGLHRPEHANLRPCIGGGVIRKGPGRIGRGLRQPAVRRRKVQPVLRGDREARRRAHAIEGRHQRAVADDLSRDGVGNGKGPGSAGPPALNDQPVWKKCNSPASRGTAGRPAAAVVRPPCP